MVPQLRTFFNDSFSEASYRQFLERLDDRCRTRIEFRVCETPCFVPFAVQRECEQAAIDLTLAAHRPEYLALSDRTLRPEYTVANQDAHSTFLTIDFAMTLDDAGRIVPKLIEMQGFPSLMGFQLAYAELSQEHYRLPPELACINGGLSRSEYVDILRQAIVGEEDPREVALIDLDPWNQKTHPDFHMIRELLGIAVVDIRDVRRVGRTLRYHRDGRPVPIRRIFNRAIVDEIERRNVAMPFNWNDDLDVTWAGHPNWYFRISKFTLPFLDHPSVPQTTFLDRLDAIPDDLDRFVLKPLYSFAGSGVIIAPSRSDIEAIPRDRRADYVLQERVQYGDVIATPEGGTRAELRLMVVWLATEARPRVVMGLTRMGRGAMMGVDFNRDVRWIGAACNFYEPEPRSPGDDE